MDPGVCTNELFHDASTLNTSHFFHFIVHVLFFFPATFFFLPADVSSVLFVSWPLSGEILNTGMDIGCPICSVLCQHDIFIDFFVTRICSFFFFAFFCFDFLKPGDV